MAKRTLRHRARGLTQLRRDDGAVAMEAAIIFPVLLLLLFGIIEFSMVLRDHVSLTSAVRSGVRVASAEPRLSTFSTDAATAVLRAGTGMPMSSVQEMWIYEAGTNGYPSGQTGFNTCTTRCIRYTYSNNSFVVAGGTWAHTTVNACPGDPLMTSVGIYIKANHAFVTGLFGSTMSLRDHAVMRFEPIPASQLTSTDNCK